MKSFDRIGKKYAELFYNNLGGMMGYLIPGIEKGRRVERAFLKHGEAARPRRPFGWACFDMESGTLLYYKNCTLDDFAEGDARPFDERFDGTFASPRTVDEQIEYSKTLSDMYEKVREFAFNESVTEEEKETALDFKKQLELTELQEYIPYYKALSPEFFEWLEKL